MKTWIVTLGLVALGLLGCSTTQALAAEDSSAPAPEGPAVNSAGSYIFTDGETPGAPTGKLVGTGTNPCDFPEKTLHTLHVAGNDTFRYWFDGLTPAKDVIAHWSKRASKVPGLEGALIRLDTAIAALGYEITFTQMILGQVRGATAAPWKDELAGVLTHLDLGFLDLDENAVTVLKVLLKREGLLNSFDNAHTDSGIGDITLMQLYTTPAWEANIPREKSEAARAVSSETVLRSTEAERETDDIGDMLTLLNLNDIIFKTGPTSCGPVENAQSGNSRCCCNTPAHGTPAYDHAYRKCNDGTASQYCVDTCLGRCCMATLVWCPPHTS